MRESALDIGPAFITFDQGEVLLVFLILSSEMNLLGPIRFFTDSIAINRSNKNCVPSILNRKDTLCINETVSDNNKFKFCRKQTSH